MQELRFVAVSEDGSYAVLAIPGRSGRYILPIDERLRAVALGQTSRLAQYEIEVESPLRPKEIQARIRAGETAEEIADAAGIPVERVRWFEGPVLAERAYIADQAQAGSVRRAGDSSGPGPRLGDIVTARLNAAGTDPADGQWDSRKRGDGNWQVSLTFPSGGRLHVAEWVFDPRRRHVMPDDDNAARLSLPESELPPEPVSVPGEATVTPIASRLGAAAGMGGGAYAPGSAVSRFRPDRSVLPDRSLGADRSLADRPAPPAASSAPPSTAPGAPVQERHGPADRSQAPAVPPRHAQQDRPGYQDRRAGIGYAEFPESAPYRAPEPEPEPGYPDPAAGQQAYQEPVAYADPAPRPGPAFRDAEPQPPAPSVPVTGSQAAGMPAASAPGMVPPAAPPNGPAIEDPERVRPAPPRQVVFDDPEPAFLGEQSELIPPGASALDEGRALPVSAAASPTVSPGPQTASREPARPMPAPPAEAVAIATPEPETARAEVPVATATPAAPAVQEAAPLPAPAPVAARTAQPATAQPATAQPATAERDTAAEPVAAPRPASAAVPAAAGPSEPSVPAAAPAAAAAGPAGPPVPEDSPPSRAGAKKTAKGRRSSVPSWDEIMLGSSRQRD